MSESVDEFLKQPVTERKPLTEEERKEAMKVASEIRKKAEGLAEGRSEVSLSDLVVPNSRTMPQVIHIRLGEEAGKHSDKHPDANLVIFISGFRGIEAGKIESFGATYYFTPDRVDKVDSSSVVDVEEEERRLTGVEELGRIHELNKEEEYHPDKADLTGLLNALSSASVIPE